MIVNLLKSVKSQLNNINKNADNRTYVKKESARTISLMETIIKSVENESQKQEIDGYLRALQDDFQQKIKELEHFRNYLNQ